MYLPKQSWPFFVHRRRAPVTSYIGNWNMDLISVPIVLIKKRFRFSRFTGAVVQKSNKGLLFNKLLRFTTLKLSGSYSALKGQERVGDKPTTENTKAQAPLPHRHSYTPIPSPYILLLHTQNQILMNLRLFLVQLTFAFLSSFYKRMNVVSLR